jgi:hypothetical protein
MAAFKESSPIPQSTPFGLLRGVQIYICRCCGVMTPGRQPGHLLEDTIDVEHTALRGDAE